MGHPLSRSYGAILPSSLARVLSRTLGFSPRLPVPVCGTVTLIAPREVFLGSVESVSWFGRSRTSPLSLELMTLWICLEDPPTIAAGDIRHPVYLSYCVTPRIDAFKVVQEC